jgi:hypothetical protein
VLCQCLLASSEQPVASSSLRERPLASEAVTYTPESSESHPFKASSAVKLQVTSCSGSRLEFDDFDFDKRARRHLVMSQLALAWSYIVDGSQTRQVASASSTR